MDASITAAVVVDTSVYGELFLRKSSVIIPQYQEHLRGKRIVLPFMVVAEMRYWSADWGSTRRGHLEQKMSEAAKEGLSDDLIAAYVELQRACKASGHPLAQKDHVADRWIAATATHRTLPLVAHDGVFKGTPGLNLITAL